MLKRNENTDNGQVQLIKCPYCFGKFTHENVHFKAQTVKTQQDIETYLGQMNQEDDLFGVTNSDTDGKLVQMRYYQEQEDPLYSDFWAKYPGSDAEKWKYAKHQFLHRSDSLLGKKQGIYALRYETDKDGFVCEAYDTENVKTAIRICPHCHNPLPPSYGKYPVKFISVVGITSSGKTVYLSQLLKNFNTYMGKGGCVAFRLSDNEKHFVQSHQVERDVPLPIGTPPSVLSTPLFYNIKNKHNETYTIVLYDIAGENCVVPEKMEKFGPFILNADAFILLMDPQQFSDIHQNLHSDIDEPTEVLNAMYNAFMSRDNQPPKTPMAASFSKSDRLKERFAEGSHVFMDIETQGGFDVRGYTNVKGEVKHFLNSMPQGQTFVSMMEELFRVNGYFAFTALDCEVRKLEEDKNGQPRYAPSSLPNPKRIEEPLLWILHQLGVVDAINSQPSDRSWWQRLLGI